MPAVTLVVGDEELLVNRAVARVVEAARTADPAAEVLSVSATDIGNGGLAEPTLFATRRVIVVRDVQDADKAAGTSLIELARQPPPDIDLVVVHPGGARGKAVLEGLKAAGAEVVECPKPRWPEDRENFVLAEIDSAGGQSTRSAAQALIVAVGTDLAELANACAQLVADGGGRVDEDVVARYYTGRADTGSFTIADKAVEGDLAAALQLTRFALSVGQSAAGIVAAMAVNLRTIAQVASAGRGAGAGAVASELGLPMWKVRKAQSWSRGWRPEALARAVHAVAAADADVKGAAAHADYAVERAVLAVVEARGGA